MSDQARLTEALAAALAMAREAAVDAPGLYGYGVAELRGPDGALKQLVPFHNLVTDTGDAYYAAKSVAGVGPAAPAAPTNLTGMQIGSGGATAASKSGAGAAIVTLLAGQAFDATFPQTQNLGAGLGVNAVYRTTFAAGVGTGTVTEVVLTNGPVATASTTANTTNRAVVAGITKGAADSLAMTYNVKVLG